MLVFITVNNVDNEQLKLKTLYGPGIFSVFYLTQQSYIADIISLARETWTTDRLRNLPNQSNI